MSITVTLDEARAGISDLLERVITEDQEVIISQAGQPVARLLPVGKKPAQRVPGTAIGRITLAEDFDAPLPEEILEDAHS